MQARHSTWYDSACSGSSYQREVRRREADLLRKVRCELITIKMVGRQDQFAPCADSFISLSEFRTGKIPRHPSLHGMTRSFSHIGARARSAKLLMISLATRKVAQHKKKAQEGETPSKQTRTEVNDACCWEHKRKNTKYYPERSKN